LWALIIALELQMRAEPSSRWIVAAWPGISTAEGIAVSLDFSMPPTGGFGVALVWKSQLAKEL
jgi:hypothetical protein